MNLFTKLLTNVAGGAGALALDEAKPEWTKRIGASAPTPAKPAGSPGVAITPGAMLAVGATALLAFLPGKADGASAPMWKVVASNLTSGALIVEGTKLAQEEILPLLRPKAQMPVPGTVPLMYGVAGRPGLPTYGAPPVSDMEFHRMMAAHRRAA